MTGEGPPPTGIPGTVYLLCFGAEGLPIREGVFARHYLGWTERPVDERLAEHLAGTGSPLVRAVVARLGVDAVTLARTWTNADRHFERALKNRREAPRLCPACCAAGRARTSSPLLAEAIA